VVKVKDIYLVGERVGSEEGFCGRGRWIFGEQMRNFVIMSVCIGVGDFALIHQGVGFISVLPLGRMLPEEEIMVAFFPQKLLPLVT
jgi:hypothetical protein